ncbi:MAG: type II and III secretion system protein [Pleurocapsa sp. MO_226.B13]|nr:type II and III secretion system protein [Pleurocapsa sp. MO_226.B13]
MTFADDFAGEEQGLESDYPSAFGITFTPMVMGIAIAVAGIALAGYGFINFVRPAQEKYSQAAVKKQELQGQLDKIKTGDLQLKLAQLQADLAEKNILKSRVLSMFTSEKDLDTLLLDLDNFIAANQADLVQYQPDTNISTIDDASLGAEIQGKLKRKGISLTIEGTFNETKQILQDIERLQPLLMVQSISSTVTEKPTAILTSTNSEIVPGKQAELKTQIKLDAILPLSQAELEQAKKADEQAEQEERSQRRNRRNNKDE